MEIPTAVNGYLLELLVGLQATWERMQQLGDVPCARDGHTLRFAFHPASVQIMV